MAKPKQSSLTSSQAESPEAVPPAVQAAAILRSGPLPDPKTLEYYERVCPGSAQEIVNMAKVEQKFRHRSAFLSLGAIVLG